MKKTIIHLFVLVLTSITSLSFAQAIKDEPCTPPFGEWPPVYDGGIFGKLGDVLGKDLDYLNQRKRWIGQSKNPDLVAQVADTVETVFLKFASSDKENAYALSSGLTTCLVDSGTISKVEKNGLDQFYELLIRGKPKAANNAFFELKTKAESRFLLEFLSTLEEETQGGDAGVVTAYSTAGDVGAAIGGLAGLVIGGGVSAGVAAAPSVAVGIAVGKAVGEVLNSSFDAGYAAGEALAEYNNED